MGQQDFSSRLEKRFPSFDKEWKKLVNEFGTEFVNSLKKQFRSERTFLGQLGQFKFKLVIDNNFIFGQIKGALKKNESIEKCFLFKLMLSSSVEVYAPPRLREELEDKIFKVLPKEQQEIALNYSISDK